MEGDLKRRAFSLVELIVVIGIVSVLAAIIFPVFVTTKARAGEVTCMSNLRQLGLAMEMYKEDSGEYPLSENLAMTGYLSHAKFRCPMLTGSQAFNFAAYLSLARFTDQPRNAYQKDYVNALKDCYETRGPLYPLIVDLNHLPKIMRADDDIYGVALVYRAAGAVERVPKGRVAAIDQTIFGYPGGAPIPCKPEAHEGNL